MDTDSLYMDTDSLSTDLDRDSPLTQSLDITRLFFGIVFESKVFFLQHISSIGIPYSRMVQDRLFGGEDSLLDCLMK